MLRKAAILASIIVIAWWVQDGDARSLRREILELRENGAGFAPDGTNQRGGWGVG